MLHKFSIFFSQQYRVQKKIWVYSKGFSSINYREIIRVFIDKEATNKIMKIIENM